MGIATSEVQTVDSAQELREILGEVIPSARNKERARLHELDRRWLAASSFCLLATSDGEGRCDVSPKGDPAGFVHVVDGQTIALPERPGNRRADSLHNILSNPQVSLIFFVPGQGPTLRIRGRARIVKDAPFFAAMCHAGHRPRLALVVDIDTIFFHCPKSVMRSGLWDPDRWPQDVLPSYAEITHAVGRTGKSREELEQYYGPAYAELLYREVRDRRR